MKHEKQTGFALLEDNNIKEFGGSNLTSHPKLKRPVSTKKPSHLVMRSLFAKGPSSFLKFDREIQRLVNRQAHRHGVKVYRIANAGNHLHMVILPRSRHAYRAFIRSISGLIARLVRGTERGVAHHRSPGNSKSEAQKKNRPSFWEKRPFTRIVEWGRDYAVTMSYLMRNNLEALGFIPYKPRNRRDRLEALKAIALPSYSTA